MSNFNYKKLQLLDADYSIGEKKRYRRNAPNSSSQATCAKCGNSSVLVRLRKRMGKSMGKAEAGDEERRKNNHMMPSTSNTQ